MDVRVVEGDYLTENSFARHNTAAVSRDLVALALANMPVNAAAAEVALAA
jgi:hypothetical protein